MTAPQSLIDRVEAATGPCRHLDYAIFLATRDPNHAYLWDPSDDNHRYTSSLDAALTLIEKHHGGIIREALSSLSSKFNLHICFWPEGENYSEWLARFICAAALRARGVM